MSVESWHGGLRFKSKGQIMSGCRHLMPYRPISYECSTRALLEASTWSTCRTNSSVRRVGGDSGRMPQSLLSSPWKRSNSWEESSCKWLARLPVVGFLGLAAWVRPWPPPLAAVLCELLPRGWRLWCTSDGKCRVTFLKKTRRTGIEAAMMVVAVSAWPQTTSGAESKMGSLCPKVKTWGVLTRAVAPALPICRGQPGFIKEPAVSILERGEGANGLQNTAAHGNGRANLLARPHLQLREEEPGK